MQAAEAVRFPKLGRAILGPVWEDLVRVNTYAVADSTQRRLFRVCSKTIRMLTHPDNRPCGARG
jgi:hypothetical protein